MSIARMKYDPKKWLKSSKVIQKMQKNYHKKKDITFIQVSKVPVGTASFCTAIVESTRSFFRFSLIGMIEIIDI
jgi:hypothetical protein